MTEKNNSLSSFNPNEYGNKNHTIFSMPHTKEEAYIHLLPVPWEVTTSYIARTAKAPEYIFDASFQVDLWDEYYPHAYERGYYYLAQDDNLYSLNQAMRPKAEYVIQQLFCGVHPQKDNTMQQYIKEVNDACQRMNHFVYEETSKTLNAGKKSILIGGDHSSPYGHIKALAKKHDTFSMLVIDAHMDMRMGYEFFNYSHASIMYNLLEHFPQIKRMSMVGIRDYCEEERAYALSQRERVEIFFNHDIKRQLFEGSTWKTIVDSIVESLSDKVYISVDIDGLLPFYCRATGTPVVGGLEVDELFYLLHRISASGRKVIGADLCEVGHNENEWDANVGARVIYKLCNMME